MPIVPELRRYLEEGMELASDGTEFVITRYRQSNANLRTALLRYILRAGLKPRPKLFNNLRSSCQTELEERFPSHVVCAWLGNSERIAREHYLQVTDAHFERAIQSARRGAWRKRRESGGKRGSPKCKKPLKTAAFLENGSDSTGRGGTRTLLIFLGKTGSQA